MWFYVRDLHFQNSLEIISRTKDKRERLDKFQELEQYVIPKQNPFLAWRLALEARSYYNISELENIIIGSKSPEFIFRFARTIKKANINRLQQAMEETKNIVYISEFICFIPTSDPSNIENLLNIYKNPRAAYIYLRYFRGANLEAIKDILLKSKKPRYVYEVAKKTKKSEDIELIQDIIINSKSNAYVRLFAKHIPGADIKKLEDRIIKTQDIEEIKKFAKVIKTPRMEKILFLI